MTCEPLGTSARKISLSELITWSYMMTGPVILNLTEGGEVQGWRVNTDDSTISMKSPTVLHMIEVQASSLVHVVSDSFVLTMNCSSPVQVGAY